MIADALTLKNPSDPNADTVLCARGVPKNLGGRTYMLLDDGTPQAEFRKIQDASGRTVRLDGPLRFPHHAGDRCLITYQPEAHAVWWGVKGLGTWGAELNAALWSCFDNGAYHASTLIMPKGVIDSTVDIDVPHEMTLRGQGPLYTGTLIRLKAGFKASPDNAAVRQLQAVSDKPVPYTTKLHKMGRINLQNFGIDTANIPGANGILCSNQQPSDWKNLRISSCQGDYGLCMHDGQDMRITGLTFQKCRLAIDQKGQSFVKVYDLNIEDNADPSPTSRDIWVHPGMSGQMPFRSGYYDLHFERSGWRVFDVNAARGLMVSGAHVNGRSGTQRHTFFHAKRTTGEPIRWMTEDVTSLGDTDNLDFIRDVDKNTYKGQPIPAPPGYVIPAAPGKTGSPSSVKGPPDGYLEQAASND